MKTAARYFGFAVQCAREGDIGGARYWTRAAIDALSFTAKVRRAARARVSVDDVECNGPGLGEA